jgi:sulfur-carrier protein adenylyltransferase/sulfurtransferase
MSGFLDSIFKRASISDQPGLSNEELARYGRHLSLPEVGTEGQLKLKQARVLLIGAGGLGSPIALYLAAAGVGHIGLVDDDKVDVSNLQRQVAHGTRDVGRPKTSSARDRITDINPHVKVEVFQERLSSTNALKFFRDYDVIVDGTDNFPTRYLVNDTCVLLGKPYVYGSIYRFEGQASVFWAGHSACYRCLFPEPPPPGTVPSCAEGGVLGVLPGIIGCIQANEAIKLIIGRGEPLFNRLLLLDALAMQFRELTLQRDPECPVCGNNPTIKQLIDYDVFCGIAKPAATPGEISVLELNERLKRGDKLNVIDVREPYEHAIAQIPGAKLIPMGQLLERAGELDPTCDTVLLCRSGGRSAHMIRELKRAGYTGQLLNLTGGIHAWSDKIDPTVPKY